MIVTCKKKKGLLLRGMLDGIMNKLANPPHSSIATFASKIFILKDKLNVWGAPGVQPLLLLAQ